VEGKIERRLVELGIVLPQPRDPVANFVSFVTVDRLVFMSGQLPRIDGNLAYRGKLGREVSLDDGKAAARLCRSVQQFSRGVR
jgi:enamine deaminase RidA (YjgF/YER057c/UK114 family)